MEHSDRNNTLLDVVHEPAPILDELCYGVESRDVERAYSGTRPRKDIEPGCLLPVQYYDLVGRSYHLNGEFRLLLALLTDAVSCYVRYAKARDPEQRRLFNEAYHWFHSSNQRGLFAFETVCDVLGLEPDAVRKSLKLVSAARLRLRRHSARVVIGPLNPGPPFSRSTTNIIR